MMWREAINAFRINLLYNYVILLLVLISLTKMIRQLHLIFHHNFYIFISEITVPVHLLTYDIQIMHSQRNAAESCF